MVAPGASEVGTSTGRQRWHVARFVAGFALTIAALPTLVLFVLTALVHQDVGPPERSTIELQDSLSGSVFEIDMEAINDAYEARLNRENRMIGGLGALVSCLAALSGWRLWRSPWRLHPEVQRGSIVLVAGAVSLLAAVSILVIAVLVFDALVD